MIHADVLCDSSVALVANAVECEHSSSPDSVWGNTPLWDLGYSKLESEFIKTRISPQAVTCASFEYYRNATSQLKLGADRGSTPVASVWRILPSFRREAIMDLHKLDAGKLDAVLIASSHIRRD